MKITVINGPNLNLLGQREPEKYGHKTLNDISESLSHLADQLKIEISFFQSNSEGELVGALQEAGRTSDGVILNAAAYTHTSVALRDAVLAIMPPVIEVHLTNPQAREEFRRKSYLSDVCKGSIAGFGEESYSLALLWFHRQGDTSVNKA